MKIYPILLAICLVWPAIAQSSVELGGDLETVLDEVGKPIGTIELRDKTLLLYPQGEIVLRDDKVTEIDLMSDQEFEADQARLRREREEWLVDQAHRAELRTKEGIAIKATKLSSRAFAALPAKDRVKYWRSFQTRYPEIDVSSELASALESYQTELAQLKTLQRMAELEARVAEAQKEATAARLEAKRLKEQSTRNRRSTRYGLRYYYDPVVRSRCVYRPPTVTIFTNGTKTEPKNEVPDYRKFPKYNPDGTAERVARIFHERKMLREQD